MKHSLRIVLSSAVLWLGLAATSHADISFVATETNFDASTNDTVSWNQYTTNVGENNPLSAIDSHGSIHLVLGQALGSGDFNLGGPPFPFPSGENVYNNQDGGDVTITFDHALAGFGVNLEDGYNGVCVYTFSAYNVTANATNVLATYLVTNSAGNHVTFVGVLDTALEINRITLHDTSLNTPYGNFLLGRLALATTVTATVTNHPVLSIVSVAPYLNVLWPTNQAAGFTLETATNLVPPVAWATNRAASVMYRLLPSVLKVYPVGTTSPTSDFEQPNFSSFDISVGRAGSEELVAKTSKTSSRK